MTHFRHCFSDLKEVHDNRVFLSDDYECQVKGIGSSKLSLLDGTVRVLNDIMFVTERKRNLISLGTLYVTRCSVKISDRVMKVMKGILVAFRMVRVNGLYL